MTLEDLGFTEWHRTQSMNFAAPEEQIARIVAVDKDRYLIRNTQNTVPAEITGKILFTADRSEDLPCVGDWVFVQYYDNYTHAIITDILARKSILRRKTAGKQIDYQLIAANIDTAFIVQSCDVDYNLRRLERYIVMIRDGKIEPALLLTKCDLITQKDLEQKISQVKQSNNIKVFALSNMTKFGYEGFKHSLSKGKTYCLIGSSGVGKSTLLNNLLEREEYATKEVRAGDGKGKHTTTRRQLTILESGEMFIDTPGMRELGMTDVSAGLNEGFSDIIDIAKGCRFDNCSHTTEIGCAVLSAVTNGKIDNERYQNYLKLIKESQYYEMTYIQKRKKDKAFGKFIKDAKKYDKRGK